MFSLFVYLFAAIFILLLVCPARFEAEEAGLRPASGAKSAMITQLWLEACNDDGSWLVEIEAAEIEELVSLSATPAPVLWNQLSDRQIRSLCKLHDVKCNKRGRVAQSHRERLMEVA